MTDFSLYPLLLPQLASDSFQNVPFCSGKRALQHHALLAPATPSPPQQYLPSSHPLLSLLPVQKVRFALQNFVFLVPGPIFARSTKTATFEFSRLQHAVRQKPKKCTFVPGTNFLYQTKPRLVHFFVPVISAHFLFIFFFKKIVIRFWELSKHNGSNSVVKTLSSPPQAFILCTDRSIRGVKRRTTAILCLLKQQLRQLLTQTQPRQLSTSSRACQQLRRRGRAPRGTLPTHNQCCSPLTPPWLLLWKPSRLMTGAEIGRHAGL